MTDTRHEPDAPSDVSGVLAPDDVARTNGRRSRVDWGPYGLRPLRVLSLVAFIDAVDRGILPGVLSKVQDDLGFSDTKAGVLGTAFVISGFLVMLPAGYLADRRRRTRIIATVLASWGAISALNATVRNYWQFLAVRATLGVGETVDNPSSQSLLADYYRAEIRGRAYGLQRLAPLVGTAVGTGLGGLIGSLLGWRWAFLLVGVPGSLVALAVWRLPEPRRGESDHRDTTGTGTETHTEAAAADDASRNGARALFGDVRAALQIRTLRSLMVGLAMVGAATAGLAFWAPAFYERHTSLGSGGGAGVTAGLILVGALVGTYVGGRICDSLRPRDESAAMLIAGVGQLIGGALLMVVFLPSPLALRIVGSLVAVMFLVGGLPALAAMTSEVVSARVRGTAFAMTTFLSAAAQALSPLVIGLLADQFTVVVDGEEKGHLANAFLIVTPLVFVGGFLVLRGRRWVARDIAAARVA